jgi:uncharacterized protein
MDPSIAPELDLAAVIASLLILVIIISSAALWIARVQRSRTEIIPNATVPAWSIGWINFGIFICLMVVTVVVVQSIGASLFFPESTGDENALDTNGIELTPTIAIVAVLMLQLPMLGVFYAARTFYPSLYSGSLNDKRLTLLQAIKASVPLFVRFLPIIWFASYVWTKILAFSQSLGLIDAYEPQELITLFAEGGRPITIGILVILAVVLAPIVEETIFRGCIYRFFKSQTTMLPAQIISGVLFAMMHLNLLSFVPLIIVGIFLARVYESSGNILVPMCFHALFNGFSLLMLLIMSQSAVMQ